MHEMSISQALLDMAVDKAGEAGAASIKQINLVIGEMSSVIDESVQFYFDFLSKGTPAEGALLTFKRLPVRARCRACSTEFQPEGEIWRCPQCGEQNFELCGGSEFYMDSIEVEK
jgi:hydrogenase nickel incorporation protein HypA/HybF